MHEDLLPTVDDDGDQRACQLSRRRFLQAVGISGASVALLAVPGCGEMWSTTTPLEPKRLASLSDLAVDQPMIVSYPDDYSPCILVKLGVPAGGGVGPESDVVAFSASCPHMGMTMVSAYNAKHKGLGPCPSHLSRFDLTRYGILVSGHATQSLPQVLLEVRDGDLYGTGMRGLIYGRTANVG
jgi:arsenite oxidase small subunit